MTTFRRFVVLQLLFVWQGGFFFYAAVVVPIGTSVLGGAAAQGVITARVTDTMNVIAVLALAATAWELNYGRDRDPRRTAVRWWCWVVALLCQLLLFYCHQLLDAFMDPDRTRVVVRSPFRPVHRVYLWAITVQWAAYLLLAWLTLRAWRAEDSAQRV